MRENEDMESHSGLSTYELIGRENCLTAVHHLIVASNHAISGSLNTPMTIPPVCNPIDHHPSGLACGNKIVSRKPWFPDKSEGAV